MRRSRKLTVVVAGTAVVALAVGLGGGAIAASRVLGASDESKAVIDDAAKQLGVQPQALADALKKAQKNRIDAAVAAGLLTKEQAEALKARIDEGDYPMLFGPGMGFDGHGPWGGGDFHGPGFGFGRHTEIVSAAAAYLGMSEADLRAALEDKTLAEVAKDKGKSVSGLVNAIVEPLTEKLDQAVADGRLTKAQATEVESRLRDRVQELVNGDLRRPDAAPNFRFWPGSRHSRAPPHAFAGPRA